MSNKGQIALGKAFVLKGAGSGSVPSLPARPARRHEDKRLVTSHESENSLQNINHRLHHVYQRSILYQRWEFGERDLERPGPHAQSNDK